MEKSKGEKPVKAALFIEIHAELKNLLGELADEEDVALNEYIAKLLARHVRRPDLAFIPRKRMGRPRKQIAV